MNYVSMFVIKYQLVKGCYEEQSPLLYVTFSFMIKHYQ